jgi:hypothetical protein
MTKLAQFKLRAAAHGQALTVYPFAAWPAGTYVDSVWTHPDPDHANYPASPTAIPGPTYGTAVVVNGFVQPARQEEKGEVYVEAVWGEEVKVALVAYIPGDQAVTLRDKIVVGGVSYWVARLGEHKDKATRVLWRAELTESVPTA